MADLKKYLEKVDSKESIIRFEFLIKQMTQTDSKFTLKNIIQNCDLIQDFLWEFGIPMLHRHFILLDELCQLDESPQSLLQKYFQNLEPYPSVEIMNDYDKYLNYITEYKDRQSEHDTKYCEVTLLRFKDYLDTDFAVRNWELGITSHNEFKQWLSRRVHPPLWQPILVFPNGPTRNTQLKRQVTVCAIEQYGLKRLNKLQEQFIGIGSQCHSSLKNDKKNFEQILELFEELDIPSTNYNIHIFEIANKVGAHLEHFIFEADKFPNYVEMQSEFLLNKYFQCIQQKRLTFLTSIDIAVLLRLPHSEESAQIVREWLTKGKALNLLTQK